MIELIHKFIVLLRNFEVHFTQNKYKKAGLNLNFSAYKIN